MDGILLEWTASSLNGRHPPSAQLAWPRRQAGTAAGLMSGHGSLRAPHRAEPFVLPAS
ncbi:MAG: hypothetical protein GPOALKHO_000763 [Sodalis sp.]|nr:MAG: hypothetical protein GPOALKHO_000763 [Sodalis sp.]